MTMLDECRQQELCHPEPYTAKSFISKTKQAFALESAGFRFPPPGTGAAHLPNRGA